MRIEGANKNDVGTGKVRVDLIPTRPLEEIAGVLAHGAEKYGQNNWRGGLRWSRYYAAILRHLFAWERGEDMDPDSELGHLAHAATCMLFLMEMETTRRDLDDRFRYTDGEVDEKTNVTRYLPRDPLQTGGIAHGADADKNG